MTLVEIWEAVKSGGPAVILLELLAIGGLLVDRNRLLKSLSAKDNLIALKDATIEAKSTKLESLSERLLVVITEVRTFLFSGRQ